MQIGTRREPRRERIVAAALACMTGCKSPGSEADARPTAEEKSFEDQRTRWLTELAEPVAACVARKDTSHAAFHGCYDWHSSVHGHWALYAVSRLTGQRRWREAADAQLTPSAIADTQAAIEDGSLDEELPYGFAWFLLLATEHERANEAHALRPVADIVAARLHTYIRDLPPSAREAGIAADDYDNLSWAVLNLWRWAKHRGDPETQAWCEAFVNAHLAKPDGSCRARDEGAAVHNFFSPCLLRAHAVEQMAQPSRARAWLANYVDPRPQDPLAPLTRIERPHPGGLNFSRAWGLWSMFRLTDQPRWRSAYEAHVSTHMTQPQYWREDYDAFSHWVPQFGVYALDLSAMPP